MQNMIKLTQRTILFLPFNISIHSYVLPKNNKKKEIDYAKIKSFLTC